MCARLRPMKHTALSLIFLALSAPTFAAQLNTYSTLIDNTEPSTIQTSEPRFTKVIEDLPLMPGLDLVPQEDMIFLTHTGRIAATTAEGLVDVDQVYYFYASSLPQLGWKKVDARNYIRNNEHLRLDAKADGKVTRVKFSVTPEK